MTSNSEPNDAAAVPPRDVEDFVRWDPENMATGIESIDLQHQELIRRLNDFHRAHVLGSEADEVKKMLKFLGQYAESHFQHEEALMDERRCPLRGENRSAHAHFLREYQELASLYSIDPDTDQMEAEIKSMVARWLVTHICRVDVALRNCPAPEPKKK